MNASWSSSKNMAIEVTMSLTFTVKRGQWIRLLWLRIYRYLGAFIIGKEIFKRYIYTCKYVCTYTYTHFQFVFCRQSWKQHQERIKQNKYKLFGNPWMKWPANWTFGKSEHYHIYKMKMISFSIWSEFQDNNIYFSIIPLKGSDLAFLFISLVKPLEFERTQNLCLFGLIK